MNAVLHKNLDLAYKTIMVFLNTIYSTTIIYTWDGSPAYQMGEGEVQGAFQLEVFLYQRP